MGPQVRIKPGSFHKSFKKIVYYPRDGPVGMVLAVWYARLSMCQRFASASVCLLLVDDLFSIQIFKVCLFCVKAALEMTGESVLAPLPPEVLCSRMQEWKKRVCANNIPFTTLTFTTPNLERDEMSLTPSPTEPRDTI